jgi:hypothetical protein
VAAVVERRQRHLIKGSNAKAMAAPATETFGALITAAVFVYAGWRAGTGGMTAGVFFAFIGAWPWPCSRCARSPTCRRCSAKASPARRRLFEVLDVAPGHRRSRRRQGPAGRRGAIALDQVSFAYGDNAPALIEVSLRRQQGRDRRPGRPLGRRQELNPQPDPALLRRDGRRGDHRRPRRAQRDPGVPARPHRPGHPGAVPVRRHHPRQHRLRPPQRRRGRDRGGRPPGGGPRLHLRAAAGLRHPGRRGRGAAVGRPAPAHRHRPRLPQGRPDPAAGRGHQRPGHRERGPGPGGAGAADGRPHHDPDRPPPVDREGRRPHLRDRPGPGGRDRDPRLAGAPQGPLRPPGQGPGPGPAAGDDLGETA